VLLRPFGIGEWVWALGSAFVLVVTGLVPLEAATAAIAGGNDVYLFLAGMMVLAELARREGVFAWLAACAVSASRGSKLHLFALVYCVGTIVTIVLSNDATAIVLTPAVAAVARRAKVPPRPYVLACAFVANAASFVLPISNPANLIVFAGAMPALGVWLRAFALPAAGSILVTYGTLRWYSRRDLGGTIEDGTSPTLLSTPGAMTLAGIVAAAIALLAASSVRGPIGLVTAVAALAVLCAVGLRDRANAWTALASVSWSILPLVAGLFVLVRGLAIAGTIDALREVVAALGHGAPFARLGAVALGTAFACNLTNNLPLAAIAGEALAHGDVSETVRYAAAIGIDLGPNLSVTGSLATILWVAALRREGIAMDAWRFLRAGAIVMPAALIAAVGLLMITTRSAY
jgi:arsenical pump membrane protein